MEPESAPEGKSYALPTIMVIIIVLGVGYYFLNSSPAPEDDVSELIKDSPGEVNEANSEGEKVQIETVGEGEGEGAKSGDTLLVHYTGTLTDGTKFDSSIDRDEPFRMTLGAGQVIQGWEEGLVGMKLGEKRKLTIPPSLGYGAGGIPGSPIGPNATLLFEVELLKIN